MNGEINKINYRYTFYQQLKKYKFNLTDLDFVNDLTSELSSVIPQRKGEYYCHLAKNYMVFKQMQGLTGLDGKKKFNERKIQVIPPLLIDAKLVSDFKGKANRFNEFFSCQCTSLNNSSECPSQPILVINKRLSSFVFDDKDIIKHQ